MFVTRTAKLIPRAKRVKPVPGLATCYSFEPELTANHLGSLFIVAEILCPPRQAEEIIDLIIETLGENYYNLPEESIACLDRFENAIKHVNQALSEYTIKGNAAWVGRLSAILAVLANEELHITQAGSAEAYLYRGKTASHVTSDLQTKGPHRPIKTFANIASGSVQAHDKLLLATPALFHQVAAEQLRSMLSDNTATGAIQGLSELVEADEDADRTAVIVIEVSTADILALQAKTSEPEEIHIGRPDNPMEVARVTATPILKKAATKLSSTSRTGVEVLRHNTYPALKQLALQAAEKLRKTLRNRKNRKKLLGAGVLAVALTLWIIASLFSARALNASAQRYNTMFASYQQANQLASDGDKTSARSLLVSLQKDLNELASSPKSKAINKRLSSRPHPEDDPASINKLLELIVVKIDEIDGLIRAQATTLTDLAAYKPTNIDVLDTKLVLSGSNNTIYTYDVASKALAVAATNPELGKVVASVTSATGDGVYLLTEEPSVWLFKPADNSLVKRDASIGGWAKGSAIASYINNLYVLDSGAGQIYKHTPTAGGFSAKSAYFAADITASLIGAKAMAVDGAIYVIDGQGLLKRFISGRLDVSTALPESLRNSTVLQSTASGAVVVSLDPTTQRVGLFTAREDAIVFNKQIAITDITQVLDAAVDSQATKAYLIANDKLIVIDLP